MVYYRKYRPQTIHDLDLDTVRERLTFILQKGDVPHAFLFSGPKGLGKTSAARILAKAINCPNKNHESRVKNQGKKDVAKTHDSSFMTLDSSSIEPCNECEICISITNGSHIDVLEIDAASNRGIDEIRELRERIKYAPSELSKKIYIIDEVHMLTTEAFNALLKTLEEPPAHAVFILATTEPWKLLPTIVSRTFEVNFEKPSAKQISRSLQRIVEGESLDIEEGVLEEIAKISDGAFRDAAKNLEELAVSSAGKKITKDLMDHVFKTSSIGSAVDELLIGLSQKDAKVSLEIIQKLSEQAVDYKLVIEQIVEKLRILMHEKVGITKRKSSLAFSEKDIERLAELFNEAYRNLRGSVVPQLPLELVVLKWCILEQDQKSKIKDQNEEPVMASNARQSHTVSEIASSPSDPRNDEKKSNSTIQQSNNSDFLYKLIDSIKHENAQIAGLLRGCTIEEMTDSEIIIGTKFEFHGKKLNEQKTLDLLNANASEILKKTVTIRVRIQ